MRRTYKCVSHHNYGYIVIIDLRVSNYSLTPILLLNIMILHKRCSGQILERYQMADIGVVGLEMWNFSRMNI